MKYISILRGINVSGQKKIKMIDIKALYESLGFCKVTTYIQSGNVIFESDEEDRTALISNIENAIEQMYEFHVPVDLRTKSELEQIMQKCPYEEANVEENGTKVLVTFLRSTPLKERVDELLKYVKHPERLVVDGTHIYLYCPDGHGKTKLSNTFLEKKLSTTATTRNFKSVKKLYELS